MSAIPARDAAAHADRDHKPQLSRIEALLDALGYVGALIDPSGVLAAQRFSTSETITSVVGRRPG